MKIFNFGAKYRDMRVGYHGAEAKYRDIWGGYHGGEVKYRDMRAGYHGGEAKYRDMRTNYHGGEVKYRDMRAGYRGGEVKYRDMRRAISDERLAISDERLEINEDVFLLLTTDDTDYTVFKAIALFITRWPLAASHDGLRMKTDERNERKSENGKRKTNTPPPRSALVPLT